MDETPVLVVKNIKKYFTHHNNMFRQSRKVKAVDDLSFSVNKGECIGLAGESGCGKTTLAKLIVRLLKPDGGDLTIDGNSYIDFEGRELWALRKKVQMVSQNGMASLNPKMTIEAAISEVLLVHRGISGDEGRQQCFELMEAVGLSKKIASRYPNELSGGQCQRAVVARALAVEPKILVLDEPVALLDVSVQAQIIVLLKELQKTYGLSYIFITHDLTILPHIADRVIIMYEGKFIEEIGGRRLFEDAIEPYTKSLLAAVPRIPVSQ